MGLDSGVARVEVYRSLKVQPIIPSIKRAWICQAWGHIPRPDVTKNLRILKYRFATISAGGAQPYRAGALERH